jgi:hypothetical protein
LLRVHFDNTRSRMVEIEPIALLPPKAIKDY